MMRRPIRCAVRAMMRRPPCCAIQHSNTPTSFRRLIHPSDYWFAHCVPFDPTLVHIGAIRRDDSASSDISGPIQYWRRRIQLITPHANIGASQGCESTLFNYVCVCAWALDSVSVSFIHFFYHSAILQFNSLFPVFSLLFCIPFMYLLRFAPSFLVVFIWLYIARTLRK
jgi:hypothetical protein